MGFFGPPPAPAPAPASIMTKVWPPSDESMPFLVAFLIGVFLLMYSIFFSSTKDVEQQWQKYDPTGEWDWMAYLCCGISAAVTNAAVTMVVANWWIKIDAQTTGGLCVATMLLTMWLYRTPPEDIALPLGKKAAKAAAADDVDIISTLASDANPNPGAAKRATKSPKRDKAALRFHE